MPKVMFIEPSGAERTIEAISDRSLMENAIKNRIEGIVAECGGICACGTCRIYVESALWRQKLGHPKEDEHSLIGFVGDAHPFARLSCQIQVTDDMDGMVVHVAESQCDL